MMSSENDDRARNDVTQTASDAVDAVMAKAQDTVNGVADKITSAADAATDAARSLVSAGRDEVGVGMRKATDAIDGVRAEALDTAKRHPVRTALIVAAVAAVAGFVIGVVRSR
jgi:hypothetical protein